MGSIKPGPGVQVSKKIEVLGLSGDLRPSGVSVCVPDEIIEVERESLVLIRKRWDNNLSSDRQYRFTQYVVARCHAQAGLGRSGQSSARPLRSPFGGTHRDVTVEIGR